MTERWHSLIGNTKRPFNVHRHRRANPTQPLRKIEVFTNTDKSKPKINMVFHGPWDQWVFSKMLSEYQKRLGDSYLIIPSTNPIPNCDVYQFWRPALAAGRRMTQSFPKDHKYFRKGIHMIHDSPYDIIRHSTQFRLETISQYRYILCTSLEQVAFYSSRNSDLFDKLKYIPLGVFEDKIKPIEDINYIEKLKIGWCAKCYTDEVKGERLLIDIIKRIDPLKFEFRINSPNAPPGIFSELKNKNIAYSKEDDFDILLITSKYEGTPLPLIEAMANGRYVLSTRVGEARFLLNQNQLCDNTSLDFINKLNHIYENRNLLKEFKNESHNKVQNRTWDNHIIETEKLWKSIINDEFELSNLKTNFLPKKKNRVFIIGGAPTVLSVDLSKLKDEDVICVNKSIELIDNPKYFITMDYTFFSKINDPNLDILSKAQSSHFVLNLTNSNIFKKIDNTTIVDARTNISYNHLDKFASIIISKNNSPFGEILEDFAHGENSGFCAIQLALLAGYEEINLIGFDMLSNKEKNTHYHNGYNGNSTITRKASDFRKHFEDAFEQMPNKNKIRTITPSIFFEQYIPKISLKEALKSKKEKMQKNLMIVGYYTINTQYEKISQKLIESLDKYKLKYDIVGIKNLGNWQANTRFKAKFMEDMLLKHSGKNLLYVDVDAIFHNKPNLFTDNYDCDIAVRWQDFRWRKNECLSGTIYMANNERTLELCRRWQLSNISEGQNAKSFEQWNLGKVIIEMKNEGKIRDLNLPPEYTMIFDSMRAMYPNVEPVIEHFQASRKHNEQRQ